MMCCEPRAGRRWRQISSTVLTSLCLAASVSGQSRGGLVGTLRTLSGDVVGDAVVTATSDGRARGARTDEEGEFLFEDLVPGSHILTTDQTPLVVEPESPIDIVAGIMI